MKADKTLIATAGTLEKTLDMTNIYAGQAQIEIQKGNNMMSLFTAKREVNKELLKDIKKLTESIGIHSGGEKAAGHFHGKIKNFSSSVTEETLDEAKYKAQKYGEFQKEFAVHHSPLIDLFSNEQNINIDATNPQSLKNAKSYVNDEAIGFQDDGTGMYFLYSGASNNNEVLEVRPGDIKNFFGVVPNMSDEEKAEVFKVLQQRQSPSFNKNDIKSSLYDFISTDRNIRVANLLTTPDLMENTDGSVADELRKEVVFDKLFPKLADKSPEEKNEIVDALVQPGHENYDSDKSAQFAVNYYANTLEQENITFNTDNSQLPPIGDKTVVSYKQFVTKNNYVNIAPSTPIALPQFNELLKNLKSGNEFMAPFGEDRKFSFDKQNKTWSYSDISVTGKQGKPVTGLSLDQVKRLLNGGSETDAFNRGSGFMLNMDEFLNLTMDPSLMKNTESQKQSANVEVEKPNIIEQILMNLSRRPKKD
tara:strand:+ start:1177 stop:2607 length:1431 start_codon:yes stop_codon:yes gene_type:complete